MDQRSQIIEVTERLLDSSPENDVSTRAVCAAAGVSAPMLYRLFGDKTGLLRAVVDQGFGRYMEGKRSAKVSRNAVTDLRRGWDSHVAFAVANPSVYRLMYSPVFSEVPRSAAEALRLLEHVLHRCAAARQLAVNVDVAAQAIMTANIGVALSMVSQPSTYDDPHLSRRVRDAVHRSVLTDEAFGKLPTTTERVGSRGRAVVGAAAQLDELLEAGTPQLSQTETAMLREWLSRLTTPPRPRPARSSRSPASPLNLRGVEGPRPRGLP